MSKKICGEAMLFEHAHRFLSTTTFVPEAQVVERIWEVRKKVMADQSRFSRTLKE